MQHKMQPNPNSTHIHIVYALAVLIHWRNKNEKKTQRAASNRLQSTQHRMGQQMIVARHHRCCGCTYIRITALIHIENRMMKNTPHKSTVKKHDFLDYFEGISLCSTKWKVKSRNLYRVKEKAAAAPNGVTIETVEALLKVCVQRACISRPKKI